MQRVEPWGRFLEDPKRCSPVVPAESDGPLHISFGLFGLKDFSAQPLRDARFYRLHHLYDYARLAFGSRLSLRSYRSHWNQIESVVESFPREHNGQLQILKTVALLNLVDVPSLLATDAALLPQSRSQELLSRDPQTTRNSSRATIGEREMVVIRWRDVRSGDASH
jgi:hypothetical protein